MFGLGNNDDEERMWNFITFGFWGTDKELKSISPFLAIMLVVAVIVIVGFVIFG